MKKKINLLLVLAMMAMLVMPVVATADDNIEAYFQRDDSGSGTNGPIIVAKWEMNNMVSMDDIEHNSPLDDDLSLAGAQFEPTGEWDTNKEIYVCGIVTDPNGVADVNAVNAKIFYPEEIALGPGHDDEGCGEQHGLMIELHQLDEDTGYELFCENVQGNHNDLPTFDDEYGYNNENPNNRVCGLDGMLKKQNTRVYCKYTSLKWEDPAGDYRVEVSATDGTTSSDPLVNHFTYLPLTGFEVDFQFVNYGDVKLNTHQIVNGDLSWDVTLNDAEPSVRNIGNTRLTMTVWQDDMGLGETINSDRWWNVRWDARVGSSAGDTYYDPFETAELNNILELSQLEEMDFSILVKSFEQYNGAEGFYEGEMVLGAIPAAFLPCCPTP